MGGYQILHESSTWGGPPLLPRLFCFHHRRVGVRRWEVKKGKPFAFFLAKFQYITTNFA